MGGEEAAFLVRFYGDADASGVVTHVSTGTRSTFTGMEALERIFLSYLYEAGRRKPMEDPDDD